MQGPCSTSAFVVPLYGECLYFTPSVLCWRAPVPTLTTLTSRIVPVQFGKLDWSSEPLSNGRRTGTTTGGGTCFEVVIVVPPSGPNPTLLTVSLVMTGILRPKLIFRSTQPIALQTDSVSPPLQQMLSQVKG